MSSVKQIEALKNKMASLHSEAEAISLQVDEYQETVEQLKGEAEVKKAELDDLAATLSLVESIRSETQEAFNTLCIAQATGGATDADYQTFAKTTGLEVQTESETEEEAAEEAA